MDDTFDRCCFAVGLPSTLGQHRIVAEPTTLFNYSAFGRGTALLNLVFEKKGKSSSFFSS